MRLREKMNGENERANIKGSNRGSAIQSIYIYIYQATTTSEYGLSLYSLSPAMRLNVDTMLLLPNNMISIQQWISRRF